METEKFSKYQRAQKKVAEIRGFYNHVVVYLVVNIVLFLVRDRITIIFLSKRFFGNPEILENIDWEVFGTPIIWGIVLIFHAIKVFGNFSFFGKNWEEKKLQQFLNEDKDQEQWK